MLTTPDKGSRRFRRRLTAVFVLVAAVSAGLVAVVTFVLAREYRWRNLRSTAAEETRFALALAPFNLDQKSFDRFSEIYERRSDAHILATSGDRTFSSSDLTIADLPSNLPQLTSEPSFVEENVDGRPMLIAAATGRDGDRYYLYFSLNQLEDSLTELARAAFLSWLGTLLLAGAAGSVVARRTLRPVARTASAAEAIAAGDLSTRLPDGASDEFGTLAHSFNHMADEVERLINRLEEAANRERRFTADVAHELRTPLTGMAAAASLLADQQSKLPPDASRPAEILIHDVERLRSLVSELLELAQLESATDAPALALLDARTAVEAVIADAAARRNATIVLEVGDDVKLLCEPASFRRILGNLLDNAIKHGDGRILVRGCVDPEHDGAIRLDVIDDGPGLANDELPKVFQRFHKADKSRSAGGSGLGLAIALEHASRQGGSLTVANEPGHGARFSLLLQRAPVDATSLDAARDGHEQHSTTLSSASGPV